MPDPQPGTHDVLGHRLDALDLESAADIVLSLATRDTDRTALVVTLNPEIVVRAASDPELRRDLAGAALTVADGVGIVWAARRTGVELPGRVPGVDLSAEVLRRGGDGLRVYFLGGRPGVAEAAAAAARQRFGTVVSGSGHGYFGPADEDEVVTAVRTSGAQLLLCGLGEQQERFVRRNEHRLGAKVAIGVGGTLDVLAGVASRTPGWTRRLGIEWLWRVGLDPRRWHRIPRLLRFVALVLTSRRTSG